MGLGGSSDPKPSYTDTAKGYSASVTETFTGFKDRAYEYYEYGENYPYFCAVFLTGALFIFLSFFFIPVMPVSPYKTANLFNMGHAIMCILKIIHQFLTKPLLTM